VGERANEEGERVLADAVAACQHILGRRLIAAYALGSLAHGGFSALVSDVDLGLIMADPPLASDGAALQDAANRVRAGGSDLHQRLSVFWATPSILQGQRDGGRFPPLDRLDLLENGRLLEGTDAREGMLRPTGSELLIAGAEFALDYLGGGRGHPGTASAGLGSMTPVPGDDTVLKEVRDPALLVSRGPRWLTKIVLFPVRFLFTAATGQVGTNASAVDYYLADHTAPASELVIRAFGWREAGPARPEEAVPVLERELIPLYVQYIDDHTMRLAATGRMDLVECFRAWKERLLA